MLGWLSDVKDNSDDDAEPIADKPLPHKEKKRILLLLVDEFYNMETRYKKIKKVLQLFDTCYHYMIMETICENVASKISAHLPKNRIHISESNLNDELIIDFQCPSNMHQQHLLAEDVAMKLDKEGKRAIKVDKRSRQNSLVVSRVREGRGAAKALPYLRQTE